MLTCPFCEFEQAGIVAESELAVALWDAHPVTEGHTLVVPRLHVTSIYQLSVQDQAALWVMVGQVREALIRRFAPDGINIAVNDGLAAGQTIDHAHIHIIPRRNGDVPDARGGVRNIIPSRARYWEK
ncbi:MAG: HIT family protein [Candidatus Korobacteraceae bacterium]